MLRENVKLVLGLLLIVVGHVYMSGGIPWITPLFFAALVFGFWRRRRYLQRISPDPEALAADRRWHRMGELGAVAILVGFVMFGGFATLPQPNMPMALAGLAVLGLGFGLL